jgi:uncharacterized protein (TIGR03437 family)
MKRAILTGLCWVAIGSALYGQQPPAITEVVDSVTYNTLSPRLALGTIGAFQVNLVPPGLPSRDLPLVITAGGVSSQPNVTIPISGDPPAITSVFNAASGNIGSLPNGGVAQGAVFTLTGSNMGPANLAVDPNPFTNTTLLNTSVSVTVNGTKVSALMYYTSTGQVAALLPSNTPVGNGTVTVTYNEATSAAAPITVVQNNPGIFTTPPGGAGAAVLTNPDYSLVTSVRANCGGPLTVCGAANPKDVLILWVTGLGPVNGNDASGAGLGQNMPNIPLQLWIGGVQANITYQGRSGCCVGVDQIVFSVPDNVMTGCAVPLFLQIGNQVSNYTYVPVAVGSRSCTPLNPALTPSAIATVAGGGAVTTANIKLRARNNDHAEALFQKLSIVPGMFPFLLTLADYPPVGSCIVSNNPNLDLTSTYSVFQAGIDAGSSLTVKGPKGSSPMAKTAAAGQPTDYLATLGPGYFTPGDYTVMGPGGADIGPFTATLTIPPPATWTNQALLSTVTRANGLTIAWSGGASQYILISGGSYTSADLSTGAIFQCLVPGDPGTFTVPPSVLLALPAVPASPNGGLSFQAFASSGNITASGLATASIDFNNNVSSNVTFK